MPGSTIKPRTLEIIRLHKEGLKVWQIAKAVDAHATLVVSAIRRAQLRGDLPLPTPKALNTISKVNKAYDIKIGAVGATMQREASPEVWKFAAEKTVEGGYTNIAEYLIDLLTDAYYEENESENHD